MDPNVITPEWEPGAPPGMKRARVAAAAGATELGATVYELEPGAAVSPYHVHYGNEELLIVLSGRAVVRTPDGKRELEPGAVVAFPRGPDGAHRVHAGDEPVRVLLVSTMNHPEIADYPDTGTTLAITGPGQGKAFPAGSEGSYRELVAEARRTSTS